MNGDNDEGRSLRASRERLGDIATEADIIRQTIEVLVLARTGLDDAVATAERAVATARRFEPDLRRHREGDRDDTAAVIDDAHALLLVRLEDLELEGNELIRLAAGPVSGFRVIEGPSPPDRGQGPG